MAPKLSSVSEGRLTRPRSSATIALTVWAIVAGGVSEVTVYTASGRTMTARQGSPRSAHSREPETADSCIPSALTGSWETPSTGLSGLTWPRCSTISTVPWSLRSVTVTVGWPAETA